jgi:hypothetical protein
VRHGGRRGRHRLAGVDQALVLFVFHGHVSLSGARHALARGFDSVVRQSSVLQALAVEQVCGQLPGRDGMRAGAKEFFELR